MAKVATLAILAGATTLLLGLGLKVPCTDLPWEDGEQFRSYCYTDVIPLYFTRGLDEDLVPYVEAFNEYPVLTGLVMYVAAILSEDVVAYFWITAIVLVTAGAFAGWALLRSMPVGPRTFLWAASPAVLIHGLTNWDLIAVAFAAWGWVRWKEGRAWESGLLFGLGGAAKLYPVFFVPFLALAAFRGRDRARVRDVLLGAGGGFILPNVVFAVANFQGWLETWRFHATRSTDWESIWWPLERFEAIDRIPTPLIAGILAVAALGGAWLVLRREADPLAIGALFVLAFLLVNRVYSPQYTLWALPLLVLLGANWAIVGAFTLADLGIFLVRYQYYLPRGEDSPPWLFIHTILVIARWVFLLVAFLLAVWPFLVRSAETVPAPAVRAAEPVSGETL